MRYRAEIDGLRAVAVIPVIFFHAGFELFSGGFVGVDVFFVISGYLITTIILTELNEQRFSIISFYERRARRILPALFFIMLTCIPFAWIYLTPPDMQSFARSIVAVSTFTSNIQFWREAGYFDSAADLKPLLHTWSLAVEEQYYIFFPLCLMILWRLGRVRMMQVLGVLLVGSLLLAQWASLNRPSAAFYLLPTRGWELLIGSFTAFYLHKRHPQSQPSFLFQILGLAGLALIVYAVFRYDAFTPFPGYYALVPTVGTALIILVGSPGTLVNALLGFRPLVGIGLISYSAYLWHQPIFAFTRHRSLTIPSDELMLVLCVLTFPLAYLSWRFVEKPFRRRDQFKRKTIFAFSCVSAVFFVAFGLSGYLSQGYPANRLPTTVNRLANTVYDINPFRDDCISDSTRYRPPADACVLGQGSNIVGVLLGDSQSDAIAFPLHQHLASRGMGVQHMWFAGCPPFSGLERIDDYSGRCREYNDAAFNQVIANDALQFVILIGRYSLYYSSERYDNGEGGIEYGSRVLVGSVDLNGASYSESDRRQYVLDQYTHDIQAYLAAGKKVILVYPVPEQGWNVPVLAAKKEMYEGSGDLSVSLESFGNRNETVVDLFDSLGNPENLLRLYPSKLLCNTFVANRCVGAIGDQAFYLDDNHLSFSGSEQLVAELGKMLE